MGGGGGGAVRQWRVWRISDSGDRSWTNAERCDQVSASSSTDKRHSRGPVCFLCATRET